MNLPVIVAGAVVAVLGFVAALYFGSQGAVSVGSGPTVQVVVAARDLGARSAIATGDLKLAGFAKSDQPPGSFSKTSDLAGKVALVDIKQGQPVLSNLVGSASEVAGSSQEPFLNLPKGFVAFTVPTGELIGVGGYIKPGDYIDVIAVVPSRTGGFANVRTIYAGVHVIRTGADAAPGEAAAAGTPTSLTLSVSECQAEFLGWFLANATLKYSLLSQDDYAAAQSAAQTPDAACPANASQGATEKDVSTRWPGLIP